MTDEATETQSIECASPPAAVMRLLADASRLPDWAPGFVDAVSHGDDGWHARKGTRSFPLRVVVQSGVGTVDYLREVAPGREGGAYVRVLPRPGGGSVVVMTVPRPEGAIANETAEIVQNELRTLVTLAASMDRPVE